MWSILSDFGVCKTISECLSLYFSYSGYVLLLLFYFGFKNSLMKLIKVETRQGIVLKQCMYGHKEAEMKWKWEGHGQ